MGLIKDIYTPSFYCSIADHFCAIYPKFDTKGFISGIFSNDFNDMEWKQRTKHSTLILHKFLPSSFPEAASLIMKVTQQLQEIGHPGGLEYVIFPDYIETYGIDDFDIAIRAFEVLTKFITCEFAVRSFLIKYNGRMIAEMNRWSQDPHPQVRRLASEGARPRLPWAMAIPSLKKDPSPILPILENLKTDPSDSVRRSVANNLNDIAKDHPHLVLNIARKWKGISKLTDAIIKHGSRTLLKQGHAEILTYYGLESSNFKVSNLIVHTPIVKIGDEVSFSFHVKNSSETAKYLRLEYGLYYQKANGQVSRKVFKISERIYEGSENCIVARRQSFKLITTRKFYVGRHKISIVINGQETEEIDFELIAR